jgi:hypothetical protein
MAGSRDRRRSLLASELDGNKRIAREGNGPVPLGACRSGSARGSARPNCNPNRVGERRTETHIILLDTPETSDRSTGTNRKEIERLQIAEVIGVLPRNAGLSNADESRFIECLNPQISLAEPNK